MKNRDLIAALQRHPLDEEVVLGISDSEHDVISVEFVDESRPPTPLSSEHTHIRWIRINGDC